MPRLDNNFTNTEFSSRNRTLDPGRIYMAEVMDTRNVTRAGEIKVWIMGSDIPRDDKERWITALYASPFFGTSPYNSSDINNYMTSPKSFGMWFPMPFVGNKVFIFYPNITGENITPFWFACPINSSTNAMIPGIPSQFFNEEKIPLCEINDKVQKSSYTERGASFTKKEEGQCEYIPLKNALDIQGLKEDKLRGPSTAGSKRESPSMCYGFLSPLGNSFIIDDGWSEEDNKQNWNMGNTNTELRGSDGLMPSQRVDEKRYNAGFRLRTRNGTQLLVSDDGNIYAINRDGSAWFEISDDGRIHGYAKTSADIACDGDINLRSKKKIRMEADEGFVLKTSGDFSIESSGNINIDAPRIVTNSIISAPEIAIKTGNIETLTSASANMNGVFSGTLQGTAYYATNSGIIPVAQPIPDVPPANVVSPNIEEVKSIPTIIGKNENTIVSSMPSHEPYTIHDRNETFPDLNISPIPYNYEVLPSYSNYVSNQIAPITPIPPDVSKDTTIPQMQLSEHFTLADLCYSDTAYRNGISNVPLDDEITKLRTLAENILEPIWTNYNKRVIVNSGYRGRTLNAIIGGATSSQHCKGEAADIEIAGVNNYDLALWIKENLQFDQLILEYADNLASDPNSGWVHVSYKDGSLRNQCLTINRYGTKSGLFK